MVFRLVTGSWKSLGIVTAAATLLMATSTALADEVKVVRVEEDWELVITQPDLDRNGPQVTCVMSPYCHVGSVHATLELNHRTLPSYQAGGIQLQLWDGEESFSHRKFPDDHVLQTEGEAITWTQSMSISPCSVVFEITNGNSTTWGSFGGQGYLRDNSSVYLNDLNQYSPLVSVKHSGVGFAANRVQSLVLKRVRYFTDDGQTVVDNTERAIDLSN